MAASDRQLVTVAPEATPRPPRRSRRVFYLHGFASSAQSTKATYFGGKFASLSVTFRCPEYDP